MATWEKAFDTFQWENRSQSTNTPLDATHLNKVNDALDVIDDRVIELQGADADMEEEIAGKQDALTFDDVPTDGSNNPVKSNGIYDALNGKVDKNGTDRLMTAAEGTKLEGIAAGAQVNVLEGVVVDSVVQPISGKKAFIDLSGKTDLSVIAYTFNSEMGYFKGAYVTYNGKLYEFIQEHTGAWNPSHVREIRASGQYVRTGNGGYNNGDRATCEGYMTKASGNYSHAEGRETQAVGECTHAEGRETIANSIYQHVEGKYNVADNESKYIHIIGNGIDDNNRSNAMTLDWDGNLEVSGDVEDGNGEKISDKADKVTNATSGHLAGLDSNGNLTDSGVSPTEDVTVEGNPVTFDSPFEQDAKSVVVSVKPIQDLHGYDAPWPAGGGKNLYGGESNVIFDLPKVISANSNCVLSFTREGEGNVTINLYRAGETSRYDYYTIGGERRSFTVTEDTARIMLGVPNDTTITNVQLELGSSATSYAPYSNICPISGIDEVEIGVSGKNLCSIDNSSFTPNVQWVDLEGDAADTYRGTKLTLLAGTYFLKLYDTVNVLALQVYNQVTENLDITDLNGGSITLPLDGDIYIRVKASVGSQTSFKTQIELGSTPTDYEPYKGSTTTIPLPSTLYGGTVDVTEGDADSRYGYIASYNGETLPGAWISDRDVYTGSNSPTIGAEVAYELATPTTISFTPTVLELLEGTNVVSTNAEKVAVTYGRSLWQDIDELKTDTEGKLNKSDVADVEGDTASRAYSVNEFMLRSDGLYKVTAPIASGASITASNTTKTTIGAVLTALLNA